MDAAVRQLRDGVVKSDSGCPFVLVCESLATVGGVDVMYKLSDAMLAAVEAKRAQATHSVLLLSGSRTLESLSSAHKVEVLDGHADPCRWKMPAPVRSESTEAGKQLAIFEEQGLDDLYNNLAGDCSQSKAMGEGGASTAPSACVIIDNLTPLFNHHHPQQVLAMLERLRMSGKVSCILSSINEDLHTKHVLVALEHMVSCVVQLKPVSDLVQEIAVKQLRQKPHGSLHFRYKRRLGRMLAETYLYTLAPSSGVHLFVPPPQMFATAVTPDRLVALGLISKQQQADTELRKNAASAAAQAAQKEVSAAAAATATEVAPASATNSGVAAAPAAAPGGAAPALMAGGMRLELTEAERQAKGAVVLPYEHSGEGRNYQTGDFRDYLPPAAGGYGAGGAVGGAGPVAGTLAPVAGRVTAHAGLAPTAGAGEAVQPLGHILYLRDSEEEHDSDEDPDDDLDI